MKIQITMKTPDALEEALNEAFPEDEKLVEENDYEGNKEKIKSLAEQWFEYDEYVTLELDTEKKTCIVLPRKG